MISLLVSGAVCLVFIQYDCNAPEIESLITKGLEYAYVEQFDSAQSFFDIIIEQQPENPAGYFFKAALLQLKMLDECRFDEENIYLGFMKQTVKAARAILDREENLWAEFYLGSSYTYRAVYEGLRNNYFETLKYGTKGGGILQNIIKKDSTFYDAYLGAGTYEYFWARAARYVPVLKLAGGGDVNVALKKLNLAAEKSIYSKQTARNSLVFIYGEEGNYGRADTLINELLIEYQISRTFLWSKAELEFKKKNFRTAGQFYDSLFTLYNSQNVKNYSNLAQCKLYCGKCFFEIHEKTQAKEALKAVIGYKQHSDEYPKIKGYCREAYALLSRIF